MHIIFRRTTARQRQPDVQLENMTTRPTIADRGKIKQTFSYPLF